MLYASFKISEKAFKKHKMNCLILECFKIKKAYNCPTSFRDFLLRLKRTKKGLKISLKLKVNDSFLKE